MIYYVCVVSPGGEARAVFPSRLCHLFQQLVLAHCKISICILVITWSCTSLFLIPTSSRRSAVFAHALVAWVFFSFSPHMGRRWWWAGYACTFAGRSKV